MSIIHNIIPKQVLEISKLEEIVVTIKDARFVDRGNGVYYFWVEGKSSRGFDITIEGDVIEVRNTILSNSFDYELTNKIVEAISLLTRGIILDEDDEAVLNFPIFNINRILETEIHDCEMIHGFSKVKDELTIYGPVRQVHFGKSTHQQFVGLKGVELKDKILGLILKVNYEIINYDPASLIRVGSDDEKKIMQLLTNSTNCIIGKYDYILLHLPEKKPIMITNETLNSFLPSNWVLVDEYTIVAPIAEQSEWEKLLTNAKKHDLFDSFRSK